MKIKDTLFNKIFKIDITTFHYFQARNSLLRLNIIKIERKDKFGRTKTENT